MNKTLSIIIPSYNEEKTIIKILEKIHANKIESINFEIIVIDDGSSDQSRKVLESNKDLYNKLLINERNLGKGFSVKKGIENASGDYILIQDADLEYDPGDYVKFVNVISKFDPDGIIGTRVIFNQYTRAHNFFNKIGNKILTLIFNIIYNKTFTDICCCYFVFKKDLIDSKKLKSNGFEGHIEIISQVMKKGKNFYEVPINYNGRTINEGKKIRYYHFIPMLIKLFSSRIK